MVPIARAKPESTAAITDLPFLISSLIRSKINTFASTAIPIVRTIPAIPGKVNVACKLDNKAKINATLTSNAPQA